MQPVDAVDYYGLPIMEGIRRKSIPREIFSGLKLPSPRAYFSYALASGGSVPAAVHGAGKSEINIMNIVDSREIDKYMASSAGQKAILNVVSSNTQRLRRIMR